MPRPHPLGHRRHRRLHCIGTRGLHSDRKSQSAVICQVEIIGEAVKRLSPALTAAETAVPWRQIAGTRDRLIHGYFTVDLDAVWSMVEQDLPALRAQVQRIAAGRKEA
ncbi:MAG: DUF86 domain-containing protein [Ideonella sp.]|nr:DUF86 domain-containing protein [Ideonella sp.]